MYIFLFNINKVGGNLVQLASLLGHESLNTTAIYTKNSIGQLADATDKLVY
jgi:site-specific recombinase XerD